MTNQEINEAVAKVDGWRDIHFYEDDAGPGFWSGVRSLTIEESFTLPLIVRESLTKYGKKLPNYTSSYDAIIPLIKNLFSDKGIDEQDRFV